MSFRQKTGWHASLLCILALAALQPSCSGSSSQIAGDSQSTDIPSPLTVAQAVAQVQAAQAPTGVESQLFAKLQQELIRVLREQNKAAALAPTGAANAVDDLIVAGSDGEGWRLEWTYRNAGDYNRDGLVSINDLTPIGQYYLLTQFDVGWPAAQYADGNHDGAVTINDITPLGQNYGAFLAGYRIYGADSAAGPWAEVDEIDLPEWNGTGARVISYTLASRDFAVYRVEPVDGGGIAGEPSSASQQLPVPATVVLGTSTTLVTQGIDSTGGTLSGAAATPLAGISVTFPAGAVPDGTSIELGYNDGTVTPVEGVVEGPIIALSDGGAGPFEQPVAITVPFTGGTEWVPMLYDIDGEGRLSDLQLDSLDYIAGTATFITFHASEKVLLKGRRNFTSQQEIDEIDTGFRPALDAFQIRNLGSRVFESGECLGMTAFARWYYEHGRYKTHGRLYSTYMQQIGAHGFLPGSPPVYTQDVIATRAHSAVQLEFVLRFTQLLPEREKLSAPENFAMIRDALWETGMPVLVGAHSSEVALRHSLLVYGIVNATEELGENGMKLLVYDPNYPGQTREILYHKEPGAPDWSNAIFEYYEGPAGITFVNFILDGSGSLMAEDIFDDIIADAETSPPFGGGSEDTIIFLTSHQPDQEVTEYQQTFTGQVQEVEHNIEGLIYEVEPLFIQYQPQNVQQYIDGLVLNQLSPAGQFSQSLTLFPGKNIISMDPVYYNWLGFPMGSSYYLRGTGWELTPASEFILNAPVEPAVIAISSHDFEQVVSDTEATLTGTIDSPSVQIVGLEIYADPPTDDKRVSLASYFGGKLDDWNKRASIDSFTLKVPVNPGTNNYYMETYAQEYHIEILEVAVKNNYIEQPFVLIGDSGPQDGQIYVTIDWEARFGPQSATTEDYQDAPWLALPGGTGWYVSGNEQGSADAEPYAVWEDRTHYDENGEAETGQIVIKVLRIYPGEYSLYMDAPVLSPGSFRITRVSVSGEASGSFTPANSELHDNWQWHGFDYDSTTGKLTIVDESYESGLPI